MGFCQILSSHVLTVLRCTPRGEHDGGTMTFSPHASRRIDRCGLSSRTMGRPQWMDAMYFGIRGWVFAYVAVVVLIGGVFLLRGPAKPGDMCLTGRHTRLSATVTNLLVAATGAVCVGALIDGILRGGAILSGPQRRRELVIDNTTTDIAIDEWRCAGQRRLWMYVRVREGPPGALLRVSVVACVDRNGAACVVYRVAERVLDADAYTWCCIVVRPPRNTADELRVSFRANPAAKSAPSTRGLKPFIVEITWCPTFALLG